MSDQQTDRFVFLVALGAFALAFQQQALKLQRTENDRRLDDLNNEAGRLQDAVAANVSSDTWSAHLVAYNKRSEDVDSTLGGIAKFQNKLLGATALAMIFVPLITAIIVYLLARP